MFGSVMQLGRQHSWQSLTVRDRLGLDAKLEQITGMDDLISDADLMEQGPAPNPAKGKLDSYDFAVMSCKDMERWLLDLLHCQDGPGKP